MCVRVGKYPSEKGKKKTHGREQGERQTFPGLSVMSASAKEEAMPRGSAMDMMEVAMVRSFSLNQL